MHTYEIGNSFEYSLQRINYENNTYLERWKYPKDWRSYAETNVFDLISLRTTLNAYNFILESSSSDRQTQSIANFSDFSRSRRNYCVTSPFERGLEVTSPLQTITRCSVSLFTTASQIVRKLFLLQWHVFKHMETNESQMFSVLWENPGPLIHHLNYCCVLPSLNKVVITVNIIIIITIIIIIRWIMPWCADEEDSSSRGITSCVILKPIC